MRGLETVTDALALINKGARSAAGLENHWLDFKTDKPSDRETYQALAEPALTVAVRELAYAEARLLVIEVAEGLDVHSTRTGQDESRRALGLAAELDVTTANADRYRSSTRRTR